MPIFKNASDIIFVAVMFVGLSGLLVWMMLWDEKKSNELLHSWARSQYLVVLSHKRRLFLRGPFFFSSTNDRVFFVEVKCPDGVQKRGFVRFHFGMATVKRTE